MTAEMKRPAALGVAGRANNRVELSNPDTHKVRSFTGYVNADRMLADRRCAGHLQRLARPHLQDPDYPWRKWARFVANLLLGAAPGDHVFEQTERSVTGRAYDRTTTTKTRTKIVRWPQVSAATILCYGAHRLFDRPHEAAPEILAAVKLGVADALSIGRRVRYTGEDIGRALKVTAAEKIAAEAWSVEAVDVTPEQWAEMMRLRRNEKQRARRRAKDVQARCDSVAAKARELGLKPDTYRARLRRQKARAQSADQSVAFVKPPNIYKYREASQTRHASGTSTRPIVNPEKAIQRRQRPGRPKDGPAGGAVAPAAVELSKNIAARRAWEIFSPTMGTWASTVIRDHGPDTLRRVIRSMSFGLPQNVTASMVREVGHE